MGARSQCDRILEYLKRGGTLTPLQALMKFDSLRLGARISDLREAGYRIVTTRVKVGEKRVASYSLRG